jgi:hypothetical protein
VLAPGSYRDVVVRDNASLTLSGGVYDVRSIELKKKARLRFADAAQVKVLQSFDADEETYVGPAQGSAITAANIIVYVGGPRKAVSIGAKGIAFANFYAPNGTTELKERTDATGAFLGREIVVKERSTLTLASFFSGLQKRTTAAWTQEPEPPTDGEIPTTFMLFQNHPNPFNPNTAIRYQVPSPVRVRLVVYNLLGQAIRTLVDEEQAAGTFTAEWDGVNEHGVSVGSGVYVYRLEAGTFVQNRKMMLLK